VEGGAVVEPDGGGGSGGVPVWVWPLVGIVIGGAVLGGVKAATEIAERRRPYA
jgi:hypothetical protein